MRPTDKAGIFGFPARLTAQDFRSEQPHNRLPCLLARACTCPSYLIVLLHTQMCNFFIGHFEDGHRHGCGSLHLATGGCFQGHWHKGLKHGPGTYISEEGVQMAYCFEHDRLKGGPSRDLLPQVRSTKRERERERERETPCLPVTSCPCAPLLASARVFFFRVQDGRRRRPAVGRAQHQPSQARARMPSSPPQQRSQSPL